MPSDSPPAVQDPYALADAMRPRLLKDGHEYILAESDLAMAQQILSGFKAPQTRGYRGPTPDIASTDASALDVRQSAYIVGSDDRYDVGCGNTALYPARVSGLISGPSYCTGTLIGVHTVATAAHCIYSNGWLSGGPVVYSPGYYGDPICPTYGPAGQYVANWIVIPNGFRNWNDTPEFDYAAIDLSQYYPPPGAYTGWAGVVADINPTRSMMFFGYGPRPSPLPPFVMLSRAGTIDLTASNSYDWWHNLDTVQGDSGAGLLDFNWGDGYPYLMGIQSGEKYWWFLWWQYENTARKWDGQTYTFFHTYGNWP